MNIMVLFDNFHLYFAVMHMGPVSHLRLKGDTIAWIWILTLYLIEVVKETSVFTFSQVDVHCLAKGMTACVYLLSSRWLNFEKVVDALVAKNINHISLEQLRAHVRKVCFVKDRDEFNAMVEFYHSLGMIIKHRSTVILKAQWLIDIFKQLITIPHCNKAVWNPLHSF